MPLITLAPTAGINPIDAFVDRLQQGLEDGLVLTAVDRTAPDLRVHSINVIANPKGIRIGFTCRPEVNAIVQILGPDTALSALTRHPVRCDAHGLGYGTVTFAWARCSLDGLTPPKVPAEALLDVVQNHYEWVSHDHIDGYIFHGFGITPRADAGTRARLLALLDGVDTRLVGDEIDAPTAHARLIARQERQVMLRIFDHLHLLPPQDEDRIIVSTGPDRVTVGTYCPTDHDVRPHFSVR